MASELADGIKVWHSVGCPSTRMKTTCISQHLLGPRWCSKGDDALHNPPKTSSRTFKSKIWIKQLETILVNGKKIRGCSQNENVLGFFQKKATENLSQAWLAGSQAHTTTNGMALAWAWQFGVRQERKWHLAACLSGSLRWLVSYCSSLKATLCSNQTPPTERCIIIISSLVWKQPHVYFTLLSFI